jgi:type I restriction enzyme M protein
VEQREIERSGRTVTARGYNLDVKNPHVEEEALGDPETLLKELSAAEAQAAALRGELKAILSEALAR